MQIEKDVIESNYGDYVIAFICVSEDELLVAEWFYGDDGWNSPGLLKINLSTGRVNLLSYKPNYCVFFSFL